MTDGTADARCESNSQHYFHSFSDIMVGQPSQQPALSEDDEEEDITESLSALNIVCSVVSSPPPRPQAPSSPGMSESSSQSDDEDCPPRLALLLTDLQNDFLNDSPSYYLAGLSSVHPFASRRQALFQRIKELAEQVQDQGGFVYFVSTMSPRKPPCRMGTDGASLHPAADKLFRYLQKRRSGSCFTLIKQWYSAFLETTLHSLLQYQNIETLIVAGLTTNHSVTSTIRSASQLGYSCYLPYDATAQIDPALQEEMCQRLTPYCEILPAGASLPLLDCSSSTRRRPSSLQFDGCVRLSGIGSGDSLLIPDLGPLRNANALLKTLVTSDTEMAYAKKWELLSPLCKEVESRTGIKFNWCESRLLPTTPQNECDECISLPSNRTCCAMMILGEGRNVNFEGPLVQSIYVRHNALLLLGPETLQQYHIIALCKKRKSPLKRKAPCVVITFAHVAEMSDIQVNHAQRERSLSVESAGTFETAVSSQDFDALDSAMVEEYLWNATCSGPADRDEELRQSPPIQLGHVSLTEDSFSPVLVAAKETPSSTSSPTAIIPNQSASVYLDGPLVFGNEAGGYSSEADVRPQREVSLSKFVSSVVAEEGQAKQGMTFDILNYTKDTELISQPTSSLSSSLVGSWFRGTEETEELLSQKHRINPLLDGTRIRDGRADFAELPLPQENLFEKVVTEEASFSFDYENQVELSTNQQNETPARQKLQRPQLGKNESLSETQQNDAVHNSSIIEAIGLSGYAEETAHAIEPTKDDGSLSSGSSHTTLSSNRRRLINEDIQRTLKEYSNKLRKEDQNRDRRSTRTSTKRDDAKKDELTVSPVLASKAEGGEEANSNTTPEHAYEVRRVNESDSGSFINARQMNCSIHDESNEIDNGTHSVPENAYTSDVLKGFSSSRASEGGIGKHENGGKQSLPFASRALEESEAFSELSNIPGSEDVSKYEYEILQSQVVSSDDSKDHSQSSSMFKEANRNRLVNGGSVPCLLSNIPTSVKPLDASEPSSNEEDDADMYGYNVSHLSPSPRKVKKSPLMKMPSNASFNWDPVSSEAGTSGVEPSHNSTTSIEVARAVQNSGMVSSSLRSNELVQGKLDETADGAYSSKSVEGQQNTPFRAVSEICARPSILREHTRFEEKFRYAGEAWKKATLSLGMVLINPRATYRAVKTFIDYPSGDVETVMHDNTVAAALGTSVLMILTIAHNGSPHHPSLSDSAVSLATALTTTTCLWLYRTDLKKLRAEIREERMALKRQQERRAGRKRNSVKESLSGVWGVVMFFVPRGLPSFPKKVLSYFLGYFHTMMNSSFSKKQRAKEVRIVGVYSLPIADINDESWPTGEVVYPTSLFSGEYLDS